jgi:methionine aminopeptidase
VFDVHSLSTAAFGVCFAEAIAAVIEACKDGAKVVDLCKIGDDVINKCVRSSCCLQPTLLCYCCSGFGHSHHHPLVAWQ